MSKASHSDEPPPMDFTLDVLKQERQKLTTWCDRLFRLFAAYPALEKEARNLQKAIHAQRKRLGIEMIEHQYGKQQEMFDRED